MRVAPARLPGGTSSLGTHGSLRPAAPHGPRTPAPQTCQAGEGIKCSLECVTDQTVESPKCL